MFQKSNITPVIFLVIWIFAILLLSHKVRPDLSFEEEMPCKIIGHPLWQDC